MKRMIKKYVMSISAILVILMFTSTSSASFLFSKEKIYDMLPENSPLKNIVDRFSQIIVSNSDTSMLIDDGKEDDETDDEGEYDDGEHDDEIDPDGPEEDVLLPKVWNMVGEVTPDDGDEPVEGSEEITTIYSDDEVGATSDGMTIDEGEWTVDHDGEGGALERFIKIVTERNIKIGVMLEQVIKRTITTDENGISSPKSGGSAENDIADNGILIDVD